MSTLLYFPWLFTLISHTVCVCVCVAPQAGCACLTHATNQRASATSSCAYKRSAVADRCREGGGTAKYARYRGQHLMTLEEPGTMNGGGGDLGGGGGLPATTVNISQAAEWDDLGLHTYSICGCMLSMLYVPRGCFITTMLPMLCFERSLP